MSWGQPNQGHGWGQPNQGHGWGQQPTHQQGQGWGQQPQQNQTWGQGGGMGGSLFQEYATYTITTALDKNMALDVSGDPKTKGSMIIWKKHGEENQRFRIIHVNGKYMIESCQGQFCLGVANSSNGTQVHAGIKNNSPNQLWDFYPAKGQKDAYYIRSFCGRALDVCGQKTSKGTHVIQWDYNGQNNQVWYVRPV